MRLQLTGIEGVQDALKQLPKATGKNVVKRALLKSAEPMVLDAKSKAPREEGDLVQGISATASIIPSQAGDSRRPGKDEVRGFVGANYKPGTPGYAPHAHLNEWGTGPRYQKDGTFTGQMPAHPFMRPAFDAGKEGFISRLGSALWEEIDKAVKRLARKNAKARG